MMTSINARSSSLPFPVPVDETEAESTDDSSSKGPWLLVATCRVGVGRNPPPLEKSFREDTLLDFLFLLLVILVILVLGLGVLRL